MSNYIPIHKFEEITPFIRGVTERIYDFVILQSRGGLGKTYSVKQAIPKDQLLYVNGHVTPLKLYMMIKENPSKVVVFDDVKKLLQNKTIVALMLQICDMGENKRVSYYTTAKYHGEKVPEQIISNNKAIMLCNDIPNGDATFDALLSRAKHLKFNPDNDEVLKQLKTFAQDKEVLNWITNNINHFIEPLSFRIYNHGMDYKDNKQDWKHLLTLQFNLSQEFKLVSELVNMEYKQAVKIWQKETGTSSRTFDRRKAEYIAKNKKK